MLKRMAACTLLSAAVIFSACIANAALPEANTGTALEVPPVYAIGAFKTPRTLTAPKGFHISVFASGLKRPRFMAFDEKGVLYVSQPDEGEVLALHDEKKTGAADTIEVYAKGLDKPHGLAFKDGELIVAETGRLISLRKDGERLAKKVITEDIAPDGGHWTRTVAVGPDGFFYVSAGSSCNVCIEKDPRRAAVLRFKDGKAEVFAKGLRNSVGIAFHPDTKELWGVDNGRDLLGDDIPPEELNKIIEGGDYGWPYCYGDRVADPEYGSRERCEKTVPPVVEMQAHSAPLGITFGKGLKFPDGYVDALFVAFHGSWNRTVPTGYKLVAIPFEAGKPKGGPIDVITGWRKDGKTWGRPVDPVVGPDGALYLSDDYAGAVYRITVK